MTNEHEGDRRGNDPVPIARMVLPHRNAAVHTKIMEFLRTCTPAEFKASLIDAGICTADGKLTEKYAEGSDERAADIEPMPGSLSDHIAAYLAAGNEATVDRIAESLNSNYIDVRNSLADLRANGMVVASTYGKHLLYRKAP